MRRLRLDDDSFRKELGKDGAQVMEAIKTLKNMSRPAISSLVHQAVDGKTPEDRAAALVALAARHIEERREG